MWRHVKTCSRIFKSKSSLAQDLASFESSLGQDLTSLDYSAVRQNKVLTRNFLYLMHFKISKNWLKFYTKIWLIWPSYFWIEHIPTSNVSYVYPKNKSISTGRKCGHMNGIFARYWILDFFHSLSGEICGSACVVLCFFFHFEEFFRQAFVNKQKQIKTVLNARLKTCQVLAKTWFKT